jgi:hypothetical protein
MRVAEDGKVTYPDRASCTDPYTLPWVEGAEGTLPKATVDRYPEGPAALREKQAVLKAKRPQADGPATP